MELFLCLGCQLEALFWGSSGWDWTEFIPSHTLSINNEFYSKPLLSKISWESSVKQHFSEYRVKGGHFHESFQACAHRYHQHFRLPEPDLPMWGGFVFLFFSFFGVFIYLYDYCQMLWAAEWVWTIVSTTEEKKMRMGNHHGSHRESGLRIPCLKVPLLMCGLLQL